MGIVQTRTLELDQLFGPINLSLQLSVLNQVRNHLLHTCIVQIQELSNLFELNILLLQAEHTYVLLDEAQLQGGPTVSASNRLQRQLRLLRGMTQFLEQLCFQQSTYVRTQVEFFSVKLLEALESVTHSVVEWTHNLECH